MVTAAIHGITHKITQHLSVGSDASGRYFDRICSPKSVKPGIVALSGHVPHMWRARNWPRVWGTLTALMKLSLETSQATEWSISGV